MVDNEKFILLRSILQSDDHLQIRPSGDFDRISIKLNYDIEISFFINSTSTSTSSLTINNINDLHIYKLENKNSIKHEQWINIRDYFNKLIQESDSDTTLYVIIQLIQEYISQAINSISTNSFSNANSSNLIRKFRGADLIFNRILHDTNIDRSQVLIGYEDRFTGIHEIPFNEFKKVHDDQFGIPMHRIRYYKINERIVWDRISKFDSLTGSETTDIFSFDLIEGMYYFNQSKQQWIIDPQISIENDDMKIPSMDKMYLPERCQFLTWNILSESIYSNIRYEEILKTLKAFLPDIICFQEVTKDFLDLLLNEIWLKENNYYIIITKTILDNQSNGQLILMKNIQPRAYSIYSEYIIVRFNLNSNITIDLVNIYLHNYSIDKRCELLENLFEKMKTRNYMLIGDFSFGDYGFKEQNLLDKYQYDIYDLWKYMYELEENPGHTFDLTRNTCAQLTSKFPINLRSDRYLLHRLHNLSYSIEYLNMTGLETIEIDSRNNKRLNQSDHFALRLILKFQIRSISNRSALVILTSNESFHQDPSYINLLHPFFDLTNTQDDEENILLPLRLFLIQYESFNIEISETNQFNKSVIKLNQHVKELSQQIKQLFSQCFNDYDNPQFDTNKKQKQSTTKLIEPIQIPVRYIYILQQSSDDSTLFHITHQIPLGSALEPIGLNPVGYMSCELNEFFNKMNLYDNEKCYEQKQEKFNLLSSCFNRLFNTDTLHYFTYAFLSYGSFRLGLNGNDLDTVLVLSKQKTNENKTNLDELFLQSKYDSLTLNTHILNLLEKDLKNEIFDCRIIQAIYPIISIVFNDQIRVEIFIQIKDQNSLLWNFHQPIHGVHDIERLIPYVRFPSIFQHLLTFIRTWAHNVGIYGQVYGYLGGYSWAILCAYICHKYLPSTISIFSFEQFHILVKNFFSFYSNFNWIDESISLYSKHSYSDDNRGSMRILCPSPPFNNSSRSTINSTRYLILQNFQLIEKINSLEEILQISNQFPDKTIQSILQLRLSSKTINELHQWIGYMKSRLAHFLTDCEDECNLFIQTDTKVSIRKDNLERFYSIGFQLNEEILSRHRQFYYTLNKFFDQFKICSFRTDNMKISYKLMSINDWNIERNFK